MSGQAVLCSAVPRGSVLVSHPSRSWGQLLFDLFNVSYSSTVAFVHRLTWYRSALYRFRRGNICCISVIISRPAVGHFAVSRISRDLTPDKGLQVTQFIPGLHDVELLAHFHSFPTAASAVAHAQPVCCHFTLRLG